MSSYCRQIGRVPVRQELCTLMERTCKAIDSNDYTDADDILKKGDDLKNKISFLRKEQMNRMQESANATLKASLVYLNILQETQELVSIWRHLLRASRFFQADYVSPQDAQVLSLEE